MQFLSAYASSLVFGVVCGLLESVGAVIWCEVTGLELYKGIYSIVTGVYRVVMLDGR